MLKCSKAMLLSCEATKQAPLFTLALFICTSFNFSNNDCVMNGNLFPDCTENKNKSNTIHILRCFKEIYNSINLSLVYRKINFSLVFQLIVFF